MGKVVNAILAGVIAFVIALIVIIILNKVLPGIGLDAFWAGVIGLLVGLGHFFSGSNRIFGN